MYPDTNGSMMLKLDQRLLALDPYDFFVTSYQRLNTLHLEHHHSLFNSTMIVFVDSVSHVSTMHGWEVKQMPTGISPECFIGFRVRDFVPCHPAITVFHQTCVGAQSLSSYSSTLYNSVHMSIMSFLVIRLD